MVQPRGGAVLHRPGRIDVSYSEGPFKYLTNHWLFVPQPDGGIFRVVDQAQVAAEGNDYAAFKSALAIRCARKCSA